MRQNQQFRIIHNERAKNLLRKRRTEEEHEKKQGKKATINKSPEDK
jgi:topoisomerase IA-like protein